MLEFGPTKQTEYAGGHGYIVPRVQLDGMLVTGALQMGAKLIEGVNITTPLEENGRIVGVRGRSNTRDVTFFSTITIVADGSAGSFAHRLGLAGTRAAQGAAIRTYVSGISCSPQRAEIFFDPAALPHYGWVFPLQPDRINVGIGLSIKRARGKALAKALDDFIQRRILPAYAGEHEAMLDEPKAFVLRSDFEKRVHCRAGVVTAGDAAGLVNPLTGEGVAYALESGEMAAMHVLKALESGDVSAQGLRPYASDLSRRYARERLLMRVLANLCRTPVVADIMLRILAHGMQGNGPVSDL